jgi:excisionase family DNA binding protein
MSAKNKSAIVPVAVPQHTLLTAAEVCDWLRISRVTLKRWRKKKILTHVRRGRSFLYPRTAIEAYVSARTVKAA